jgi:peptidoglycan/LPS O-acetylase OafA/YrhL
MSKFFSYDALLGDLSYPVYLVHMLVLTTLSTLKVTVPALKNMSLTLWTVLFSILLAFLINRWVVQPVNRYRQARLKPATVV